MMLRNSRRLFTLVALSIATLVAGSVSAAPLTIDDFSAPAAQAAWVISLLDASPTTITTASGSVIAGERELKITVVGVPTLISAVGTVGGGTLESGSSGARPAVTELLYDGVGTGTAGPTDVSSLTKIAFDFLFLDTAAAASMSIDIVAASAGGTATYAGTIGPNPNPFTYDALFSGFVIGGAFDPTAVTSLAIKFNGGLTPNVDFELDQIKAVPEPSTAVLAGLSLLGLVALRRRVR